MQCMTPGARRPWFAAVATLLAAFASAGLHAQAPSAIAIKDARVVTASGADLAKATVLLRDGLIQDVGVNLQIPPDAWVIEGAGLTVYPGFIDGLSAWGLSSAPNPSVAQGAAAQGANAAPPAAQANQAPRSHGPEDRP